MRNLCLTAVLALSFSSALAADTLSIGNFQLVDSQRVTLTKYNVTYSASLINSGPALTSVSATVTSSDPSIQVVANHDTLNFAPVPANSQVASSNTFTILVDRSVPFDFSKLHFTFNTTSPPPIANAGPDQNAVVGTTVTLNGSGSTNPSGIGTLTYNFTFASRPAGSNAAINNPTSVMPTFVPDVPGDYIVLLTVSNGSASSTSTVKISTTSPVAPVANAGPNQTVNVGSTVVLNGSGSTDAGGKPLTYAFTITSRPAGSNATLTNPNSVSPTFVADKAGSYTVQLIVNNGTSNSLPSTVIITTQCPAPVANAGSGSNINVGSVVQLNGAGSTDVCGNPLTYQFSLITVPPGSNATLSNPNSVNPTFTADKQGNYVAQLIVNNGQTSSAPVTVTFSTNQVLAPTANAGPNQSANINSVVTLHGSGTDPNNPALPLNYKFSLTSVPPGSNATLTNANTSTPTFIADKPGTYVAQLIVNNGFLDSAPSTVMITVGTPQAPTANAGSNQTVIAPATVNLSGSGSSDPNNLPLTYSFSFTSKPAGSNATLTGATTVAPSFNADIPGTYVVQLIVNNGYTSSTPQTVTITATAGAAASVTATSGTPQSAQTNAAFSAPLVATVKDSNGFPVAGVTVTFTAPASGAGGSFSGSATATAVTTASGTATSPTFTANGTTGTYNVVASASGASSANFVLTNTAGTPASISVSSGSGQSAAVTTQFGSRFVALVKDSNGNPLSGITVTFTPPGSGASGTFAGGVNTAVTDSSGLAFSPFFTANTTSGNYNVNATVSGVGTPAVFSVTNTPGPAASITATGGTPQSIAISTAFPTALSATVKDANGNPVSGVTVTFTAPGSGASGTFANGTATTTATTNSSGVATSSVFTANTTTGVYGVTASANGVGTNANFALTNLNGNAASISATGGTPQTAQINATFSSPFVALVKDSGGNPVSGVTVTFTPVPSGSGASGSFAGGLNTSVTNGSGLATSTAFTANGTAGSYQVNATVSGVATPAVFNVTNSNPVQTVGSITVASGSGQGTPINTQFGSVLVALVKDTNGNPIAGATVTFSLPGSGASATFAGSNVAITNGAGMAFSPTLTANGTVGNYTATAMVQGAPSTANFALTNAAGPGTGQAITISGGPVGVGLQTQLTVTLPSAAGSGGTPVTVTIMDESKLKPNGSNLNGFTITIPQGANQALIIVQGVGVGNSVVYASSQGFATGMTTVSVTPSGFVLSGPNGIGSAFTTNAGASTSLTVTAARLDSSGNFVEAQALATGVTASVPVTTSNSVGTIQTTPLTFSGGDQTKTTQFVAGSSAGSTTITAGVPTGFSTPAGGANTLSATVQPGGLSLPNISVGKNLETTSSVTLTGGAPEQNCNGLGGLCVTVTSSDPSKVLLSATPTGAGSSSITLRVPTGLNHTQDFYVYGLTDNGTVPYTASASTFGTAQATVSLTPGAAIIAGPFGIGSPSFVANPGGTATINVYTAQFSTSNTFVGLQALRGGLSETITVSSSNTSVGTISPATVTIAGGGFTGSTTFTAAAPGSTDLSVSVPADLDTPPALYKTVTANVTQPKIVLTDAGDIGKNLEGGGTAQIGANAPAGGLSITLTSSNPSLLLLSPAANVPGAASITITIPAGSNNISYYVQALSDTGTASYTAHANNYQDGTSTVTLRKSGVVLSGPYGLNFGFAVPTHVGDPPTNLAVQTAALDASGNYLATQQLAAGMNLQVTLITTPTGVGTVTSPVTIAGGTDTATAQFTPTATGQTTVSAQTPAGYTPAPTTYTTVKFNVQ